MFRQQIRGAGDCNNDTYCYIICGIAWLISISNAPFDKIGESSNYVFLQSTLIFIKTFKTKQKLLFWMFLNAIKGKN